MNIELAQILSQIIALLVVYFAMKRWAWKPFLGILEERKRKISLEFAKIDQRNKEAEALHQEYVKRLSDLEAQRQEKIDEAIHEGRKRADDIQKQAHENAEQYLLKAQGQLKRDADGVKKALREEVVTLAVAIAGKITEEKLDPEKEKERARKYLDKAELS